MSYFFLKLKFKKVFLLLCSFILLLLLIVCIWGVYIFPHMINQLAKEGKIEAMEKIVLFRFFHDLKDETGKTPLMTASLYKHKDVVDLLIKNGADINKTDNSGDTALLLSVIRHDNLDVIKKLITFGDNIDKINNKGKTALYVAALFGHYKQASLLLKSGANINYKDCSGMTILMRAAFQGNYKLVQYLLANGADKNKLSDLGFNAYLYAKMGEASFINRPRKFHVKSSLFKRNYQNVYSMLRTYRISGFKKITGYVNTKGTFVHPYYRAIKGGTKIPKNFNKNYPKTQPSSYKSAD